MTNVTVDGSGHVLMKAGLIQTTVDLPLVQNSDITYLGFFSMPTSVSGIRFDYGGNALGIGPLNAGSPTLIMAGNNGTYPDMMTLSKFTIPAIGGTAAAVGSVSPTFPPFTSDSNGTKLCGSYYDSVSNRVVVTGAAYYSFNDLGSQISCSPDLQTLNTLQQNNHAEPRGASTGSVGPVPSAWQSLTGGNRAYIAVGPKLSINSRGPNGPGLFTFDPSTVNGSGTIALTTLLEYPYTGNTAHWRYDGTGISPMWLVGPHACVGAAWVPNTRSVIFFGMKALAGANTNSPGYNSCDYTVANPFGTCYGNATSNIALDGTLDGMGVQYCYEGSGPCHSDQKGQHGYPYRMNIWAYDLNDILAGPNPWTPLPYIDAAVPGSLGVPGCFDLIGCSVAYDPGTSNMYLSQLDSGTTEIHVFNIAHP